MKIIDKLKQLINRGKKMETVNKLKHLIYATVILIGILVYWQVNRYDRYEYLLRDKVFYAIDKKTHSVYRFISNKEENELGDWGYKKTLKTKKKTDFLGQLKDPRKFGSHPIIDGKDTTTVSEPIFFSNEDYISNEWHWKRITPALPYPIPMEEE
jgi:hypothetical protein